MALYQSEQTQFMKKFFEQYPEEKVAQLQGHLIWWNKKPISSEECERVAASTLKQKPYPYQTEEA